MKSVCLAKFVLGLVLVLAHAVAWAQPSGLAVNSRGFGATEDIHVLWRVNLSTGQVERIGQTGFIDMEGLALAPDGTLYGADDSTKTLVTVNINSGFSTPVGGLRNNMGMPLAQPMDFGMTFTCDGELLVSSDTERSLFRASLETGRLQRIGQTGSLGAPITGLASWGGELYGIGQGLAGEDGLFTVDAPNLYRIDPTNATAELIGSLGETVLPYANAGLAFDTVGTLWAITDRRANGIPDIKSEILRVDLETGLAQKIANAALVGFESLAIAAPRGCDTPSGTLPDPEIVPASNPLGLAIMALLILMASWWTLYLRQR
ncbi:MAG TPA: hypothetical protein VJ902_10660 [Wenzhouxiangellaceae bacterium]|nr:hypothetical protein [Wenzhouxiangellaceae bacterium]